MLGRTVGIDPLRSLLPRPGVAKWICAAFALVGALPLLMGAALESSAVQGWVARQARQWVQRELGVDAAYGIDNQLWPPRVVLRRLRVAASDGAAPALTVRAIAIQPRLLSLLSGRLDAGTVDLYEPRLRLDFQGGKLANLALRIPQSSAPSQPLRRAPFSMLRIHDASGEVTIDDIRLIASDIDIQVAALRALTLRIDLDSEEIRIERSRPHWGAEGQERGQGAVDEDVICSLSSRLRVDRTSLHVERLELRGFADDDVHPNTAPRCEEPAGDSTTQVTVAARQLHFEWGGVEPPRLRGSVGVRAPAFIGNRFAKLPPLTGWLQAEGRIAQRLGQRLPQASLQLTGRHLGFEEYPIATHLDAEVESRGEKIIVPRFEIGFAEGVATFHDTVVEPFAQGAPIRTRYADVVGVKFPGLMKALGVTEHTVVQWDLEHTRIDEVQGTLHPLLIGAGLESNTRNFVVFDSGWDDPSRKPVIAVPRANVRGRIRVTESAFEFLDTVNTFGSSEVHADRVSLSFHDTIGIVVGESELDLADIGPLAGIPLQGKSRLSATLQGQYADPTLEGEMRVDDLVFGGFPVGTIRHSLVRFRPLWLEFSETRGQKGKSEFTISRALLDFETAATLLVDADVLSEDLAIGDFLAMWGLDEDPRWQQVAGRTRADARIQYTIGGPRDACRAGRLEVDGALSLHEADLFGEHYDGGAADLHFDWRDLKAGFLGFSLEVPSFTMRKGDGVVLGSAQVTPGAVLRARALATQLPLRELDGLGVVGDVVDGRASGFVEVSGTLDAIEAKARVHVTPIRVGAASFPASDLEVRMEPAPRRLDATGTSACGHPIPGPFDEARYRADAPSGHFVYSGSLLGGQIELDKLRVSQQKARHVSGAIDFVDFDVGALSTLLKPGALSASRRGRLTARVEIEDLPMQEPSRARATASLAGLSFSDSGSRAKLLEGPAEVRLADGVLRLPGVVLRVEAAGKAAGTFELRGALSHLDSAPTLDAVLHLRPLDLETLRPLIPGAQRVAGQLGGEVRLQGALAQPEYKGRFALRGGMLELDGLPWTISDVELQLFLEPDQVELRSGHARLGSGTVDLAGTLPMRGLQPLGGRLQVDARDVHAPVLPGVEGRFDAHLVASWQPSASPLLPSELPLIAGDVEWRSFTYSRPVHMAVDLAELTQRGQRTEIDTHDPSEDRVRFDISVKAAQPLQIRNNLLEAELEVPRGGLRFTGTNQKFGLVGDVTLNRGGRITLRRNEFEVEQGIVRFDDPGRIAPLVDVTAVTEYRRYSDSFDSDSGSNASSAVSATAATGGQWRITMHAHGDADELKVDLSSEPALSQDDIFLLLTVGVTRAELDQSQSASVGGSVALEALGTLSGADEAVTEVLPVIDEFRFGSAYSSRTGRTEPTVTIGKRLAERVRATVTTGVSDSREVRSNVEWRLSPRLSLEGSYDNVNDISSSALGNLGADLRWRLEFE